MSCGAECADGQAVDRGGDDGGRTEPKAPTAMQWTEAVTMVGGAEPKEPTVMQWTGAVMMVGVRSPKRGTTAGRIGKLGGHWHGGQAWALSGDVRSHGQA